MKINELFDMIKTAASISPVIAVEYLGDDDYNICMTINGNKHADTVQIYTNKDLAQLFSLATIRSRELLKRRG